MYGCERDVIKIFFVAMKGPQVAVLFDRSGGEGLQASGNTGTGSTALAGITQGCLMVSMKHRFILGILTFGMCGRVVTCILYVRL
jgi:hypothetical protein